MDDTVSVVNIKEDNAKSIARLTQSAHNIVGCLTASQTLHANDEGNHA